MLDVTKYGVKIELIEDLLGTTPKDRSVYSNFIASKGREMLEKQARQGIPPAGNQGEDAPMVTDDGVMTEHGATTVATLLAEEVETIQQVEDRGWTGFHEDPDGPFLFDYAIKGFLSESARTIKQIGDVKQLQDKFKRYVFVKPRRIRLPKPGKIEDFIGKPMLIVTDKGIVCERPLRAMTAQGPRVTVTRSDVVLAGAVIEFQLHVIKGGSVTRKIIEQVLSYGEYMGLGQWRSGGWGKFTLLELEEV